MNNERKLIVTKNPNYQGTSRRKYYQDMNRVVHGERELPSNPKGYSQLSSYDETQEISGWLKLAQEVGNDGRDYLSGIAQKGITPNNLTDPKNLRALAEDLYSRIHKNEPPKTIYKGRRIFCIPIGTHVTETVFRENTIYPDAGEITEEKSTFWSRLRDKIRNRQ